MKKWKIMLPTVLAVSSLPLVSLVSCGAPKAENFETDPWSTVCYYANKGIDALAKAYGHENEPEWFVGQKREITLNGFEHHVKVVGINQDFIDLNHQKPVTLTFQFDNLISRAADGTYLTIKWQADETNAKNYNYWNSTLLNALNSNKNVNWENDRTEHQSVYLMIKEGDSALAKNIKSVYRNVNVYNESRTEEIKYEGSAQKTKLFCPSLSNIFSNEGFEASELPQTGTYQIGLYELEGQPHDQASGGQYFYYLKNGIGNGAISTGASPWIKYNILKLNDSKSYGSSENGSANYWLSSPILCNEAHGESSWSVSVEGNILYNKKVIEPFAIAPCFCI